MSTFTLITRKHMGSLTSSAKRTLKRIERQRDKMVLKLQELEQAEQEILVATAEHLQIDTDGPFRGLHVDDDGTVHALYCTCTKCQADLNNVSVMEATEAMIATGHIHADMAAQMRQRAATIDKQRGTPVVH